jgi:biotin transport system substrate-specific component
MVFCALSIALLAVGAAIQLPLGPVPFTLQSLMLLLILLILSPREALVAVGAYLIIGAIGLPVFAGFRGGFGVLLGPTGGFLMGFFVAALLAAALRALFAARVKPTSRSAGGSASGSAGMGAGGNISGGAGRGAGRNASGSAGMGAGGSISGSVGRGAGGSISMGAGGNIVVDLLVIIVATLAYYAMGLWWFIISTGATFPAALAACVLPFLLPDILKAAAALICARPIRGAVGRTQSPGPLPHHT